MQLSMLTGRKLNTISFGIIELCQQWHYIDYCAQQNSVGQLHHVLVPYRQHQSLYAVLNPCVFCWDWCRVCAAVSISREQCESDATLSASLPDLIPSYSCFSFQCVAREVALLMASESRERGRQICSSEIHILARCVLWNSWNFQLPDCSFTVQNFQKRDML